MSKMFLFWPPFRRDEPTMDEIQVEVADGPFAGLSATLISHIGDQVQIQVTIFGR